MLRRTLILTMLLLLCASGAYAFQGNTLSYGQSSRGSLSTELPAAFFAFQGTAGDVVLVDVIALDPALDPRLTILSPSNATLALNDNDPLRSRSRDAFIAVRLEETGTHSLLVESVAGAGEFLIRLNARTQTGSTALVLGEIQRVEVQPTSSAQTFSFDSASTPYVIADADFPNFAYTVEARSSDGEVIAVLDGTSLARVIVQVPANSGTYEVSLLPAGDPEAGFVTLIARENLGGGGQQQQGQQQQQQQAQAQPTLAPQTDAGTGGDAQQAGIPATEETPPAEAEVNVGGGAPTGRCTASPSGTAGVNVRQGPSTDQPVIDSIVAGDFRFANGVSGNGWVRLVGNGWVSESVVDLSGPCDLPTVAPEGSSAGGASAEVEVEDSSVAPIGEQ